MEPDRKPSLNRGFWYSSFSGVIVSVGLGLYLLLSTHSEWDAIGAGLVGANLLVLGPIVGFVVSTVVAGLIYVPLYAVSARITWLPRVILPVAGLAVGLTVAFLFRLWLENLVFSMVLIFVFWGALGGALFAIGAGRKRPANKR